MFADAGRVSAVRPERVRACMRCVPNGAHSLGLGAGDVIVGVVVEAALGLFFSFAPSFLSIYVCDCGSWWPH